jgi:hydrogenase/urease accessory protein HupE
MKRSRPALATGPMFALVLLSLVPGWAGAHESQPGVLELRQLTADAASATWEVSWRAPIYYGKPHPAQLRLPPEWAPVGEPSLRRLGSYELHRQLVQVPAGGLDGSIIAFPGLQQTITDVFVRMMRLDGTEASQVVRPTEPQAVLRGERPWTTTAGEYLVLGFHHILLGVDHLLFVLGLLMIVRGTRQLVETITAFTIAHSITLGLATLGLASIPGPPLNAAIALSILFLGPELVRVWRGQTSFTIRHPWVVAFGFGLLHGFGFASGLSVVGMPRAEIPLALAMFNVGVELGQLAFVALILLAHRAARVLEFRWPQRAELAPAYLIGSLGAYWTIQRTVMML